nr:HAMP domain-containing sensor histidine kinase [Gymnodinialimonas phycosphaerae]
MREQFIAVLGHDLRNPLTSISVAMRMLSKEPLSEKGQEVLTLTQGSVQRMSLLITNVLDFARHRLGGGIGLKMTEGQVLEAEIRQVVAELHTAHPEREIKLEVTGVDAVTCDVPRVGQLLSNLLGNALTYGDPTLPIAVDVGLSQVGVFTLSVENHGPPIPEQALERLFEPFVRSTDDGNPMGLGLGLYIAAQIAKAHGGTLDVVSDEDGTRFTCQIPQEAGQAAGPTA